MKGKIIALIRKKGYGFILDEENVQRFFHANNVVNTEFTRLEEGTAVEFKPITIEGRGQRAENVLVVR